MFRKELSFIKRKVFRIERPLGFLWREITKDSLKDQKFILSDQTTSVIFDVGANIGQTATKYHKLFPTARIFSFEPFPIAFQRLAKTTSAIPQIEAHQVALAAQTGEATMYVSKAHATNSLLPPVDCRQQDIPTHIEPTTVNTITLDLFCQEHKIEQIDILKMDVQGSELAVLEGGIGMIKRGTVPLIYSEITFIPQYKRQPGFSQLNEFLADHEYTLFGLYGFVYDQIGLLHWGDAVFVNRALYERLLERDRPRLFPLWTRNSFSKNW